MTGRRDASSAGLRYVDPEEPGVRRRRCGRGFTYVDVDGRTVRDPDLRARFARLAIPPAWTDVWICADPDGHVQATGRDDRGRKQYRYHPRWDEVRTEAKFERLGVFGEALPRIRARVDHDLRARRMSRDKVLAIVVGLLDETLIRVGNAEYAADNDTRGLTTLRRADVEVDGARLRFRFAGKGGRAQVVDVRDRRLARMVARCQELPGQTLFTYLDDDEPRAVTSCDVNAWLRDTTGEDLTAKDFRTWGATARAAAWLCRQAREDAPEATIRACIDRVAEVLGNTRAVARDYYVHPAIPAAWRDGHLPEPPGEGAEWLAEAERIVLAVVRPQVSR